MDGSADEEDVDKKGDQDANVKCKVHGDDEKQMRTCCVAFDSAASRDERLAVAGPSLWV